MRIVSIDLGVRNLAWAVLERPIAPAWPPKDVSVVAWRLVDISDGKIEDLNSIDIAGCVPLMMATLKQYSSELLTDVSHVFLETQPVSRHGVSNIKTKVLSHICQSFFCAHNIPVSFVSAKLKLDGEGDTYAARKKMAVAKTTEAMDVIGGEWLPWWKGRKGKKDDLADSLLQGILSHFPKAKKAIKKRKKEDKIIPLPSILELG